MQFTSLILPILLLVLMYFFLIRPQQKRAKEHREMISRVEA
ncbi:preprotein translocase subunit YajC, partial [Burkholderia multivorans]